MKTEIGDMMAKIIDEDKYGLVDGHPEVTGIYTAFMTGFKLAKNQEEARK